MKLNISVFFFAVLSVFFISSCEKLDTTTIGDDLIPAVDNVSTFDTVMDLVTDNFLLPDSTRMLRNEAHAWGVIDDPEFGKTKAEVFFSVTPAGYGVHPFPKKDSTLVIDSVVLAVAFSTTYGDTSSLQKVNVYEVISDGNFKNNYGGYRIDTSDILYYAPLLGSKVVDFRKLDDSVYDVRKRDTVRLKNQLRIPLDKTLANRFLAYDTAFAYKNDTNFRNNFSGFALTVDEAGSSLKKGLAYFLISNANTKLIFYYRVMSGSTVTDTVSTEFGFYTFNAANANTVRRTPSGNYLTALNNGTPSDDKIYLQSSPGSFAAVRIPNLKSVSNRLIHRAELIFEALPSAEENKLTKPGFLFMDADDTANKRIMTVPYDFNYQNNFIALFGGSIKNNVYNFNVTRYVQSIVTRKEKDYTLRLSAPYKTGAADFASGLIPFPDVLINSPIAAGRVVLAGGAYNADPTKRARLRIIYSKI